MVNRRPTLNTAAKIQLGQRLHRIIQERGWNQSELARQAGLEKVSISNYVRGVTVPSQSSLKKLATALNTTPEELLPKRRPSGNIELTADPDAPDRAWLRIDQVVSTRTGFQILKLLEEDRIASSKPSE